MTGLAGEADARAAAGGAHADVFVDRWPDAPRAQDIRLLDAAERSWLDRFERQRDAAAFAAGRALVRRTAAMRLRCGPDEVRLAAPPGQRPRIASAPLACSIAHGGGIVLAAVAEADALGVDVEPIEAGIAPEELAAIALDVLGAPSAEAAALRSGAVPARAFLERWTLTEAVLKALGLGLSADPREVRLDLRGTPRLVSAPGLAPDEAASWDLDLLDAAPGHVAALACSRPVAALHVARFL